MRNRHILLVEPDSDFLDLILISLEDIHLPKQNIVAVRDGAAALDYLAGRGAFAGRTNSGLPSLILMDVTVPKVDLMDFLRRIRADDRTKPIPVVIFSSSIDDADVAACYALGASSYIVKPVEYEELKNAIRQIGLYWLVFNEAPRVK